MTPAREHEADDHKRDRSTTHLWQQRPPSHRHWDSPLQDPEEHQLPQQSVSCRYQLFQDKRECTEKKPKSERHLDESDDTSTHSMPSRLPVYRVRIFARGPTLRHCQSLGRECEPSGMISSAAARDGGDENHEEDVSSWCLQDACHLMNSVLCLNRRRC